MSGFKIIKWQKILWKKVNPYGCEAGMFYIKEVIYSTNKKSLHNF